MFLNVVQDLSCPHCGADEMHPDETQLLIRAYKVCDEQGNWWSQCLVCAGYYSPLALTPTPEKYQAEKGWF